MQGRLCFYAMSNASSINCPHRLRFNSQQSSGYPSLRSLQTPDGITNLNNMIHKKYSEMARKWKKLATIGRKRIYFTRSNAEGCGSPTLADEGCFVIYSIDRRRFMVPLAYLSSHIFQKLLEMSKEEYGLSSSGPIIMPCDSVLLENVLTLIQRGASNSSEKALLDALSSSCDIQQLVVPVSD